MFFWSTFHQLYITLTYVSIEGLRWIIASELYASQMTVKSEINCYYCYNKYIFIAYELVAVDSLY